MKIPNKNKPVFVRIKKGATIYRFGLAKKIHQILIEDEFYGKVPTRKNDYNDNWRWDKLSDSQILINDDFFVESDQIIPIIIPSLSKEKRALLVKNSEWMADNDMPFVTGGIDPYFKDYSKGEFHTTIPRDKTIKVLNPKSKIQSVLGDEKCIRIEIDAEERWMPVRFLGNMSCSKKGKEKTYWKLIDKYGELVRTKKYDNIGGIKSSIRIITGLVTDAVDDDGNETGPWWIDGSAAAPGFTAGDSSLELFDNWTAVEYLSVNDSEIQRVDLKKWYESLK